MNMNETKPTGKDYHTIDWAEKIGLGTMGGVLSSHFEGLANPFHVIAHPFELHGHTEEVELPQACHIGIESIY